MTPIRTASKVALSALSVLALLALTTPARAAGTRAGTNITNQATVSYKDANNNVLSALSNIVTTTVSQVAAVDVSPNNTANANPSNR